MRNKSRIQVILKKISYMMNKENKSIMKAVYTGIPNNPKDPYYYEDNDWLNLNKTVPKEELNEKTEKILSIWEEHPDLRLTQLICNTLPNNYKEGEGVIYSKHPIEYSDQEILQYLEEFY